MQKDLSIVRIGSLWNQGSGATFKDELEVTPDFGSDIHLTQPVTSDLFLIRMKDGITVILENINSETELQCSRCLTQFKVPLHVKSSERQFFEVMPERDYDPFEVFLINREKMAVDLTEMMRQELILHFPMIPVCSERCKGLCSGCRINLNSASEHLPNCPGNASEKTEEKADKHRPFANLKDLFKK